MSRTLDTLELSPFARLVGLRITKLEKECSECFLEMEPKLLNVNGTMHGGAIYSIVDVGMGTALHAHLAAGERCTTIENNINYLAPVTSGTLFCISKLVHKSRTLAVLESQVENDGRLIAKATGTFYISKDAAR
jgi:uncharacterized protein (TIGR00369 family)